MMAEALPGGALQNIILTIQNGILESLGWEAARIDRTIRSEPTARGI
jgi:hypothetical protein